MLKKVLLSAVVITFIFCVAEFAQAQQVVMMGRSLPGKFDNGTTVVFQGALDGPKHGVGTGRLIVAGRDVCKMSFSAAYKKRIDKKTGKITYVLFSITANSMELNKPIHMSASQLGFSVSKKPVKFGDPGYYLIGKNVQVFKIN